MATTYDYRWLHDRRYYVSLLFLFHFLYVRGMITYNSKMYANFGKVGSSPWKSMEITLQSDDIWYSHFIWIRVTKTSPTSDTKTKRFNSKFFIRSKWHCNHPISMKIAGFFFFITKLYGSWDKQWFVTHFRLLELWTLHCLQIKVSLVIMGEEMPNEKARLLDAMHVSRRWGRQLIG